MNATHALPVLVTGTSSGIGYCIAHGLARHGYRVFATARSEADVARLAGEGLRALQLDLRNPASLSAALDTLLAETGGVLYGLVNNGAYGQPGAVEDLSRDTLRAQFETNVFGTQELTNLVIPHLRRQGAGRIIQISSILGLVCLPFRGAYNASKYALEALTDTLRVELAGTGIKVSLIEPGPIRSHFRPNSLAALHANIDTERSHFRDIYRRVETRLNDPAPARFTLPPGAVLDCVVHALGNPRPKIRYLVTTPSKVMARAKRALPAWLIDRIVGRAIGAR